MTPHTTGRVALLTALATPLLAAACSGGSTTDGTAAPTTTPAATSTPATTPNRSAALSTSAAPTTSATSGAQQPVPAESNPPGDIPDDVAFVPYRNPSGHYTFRHPEGWLVQARGASATFTDKLNGVLVEPGTVTTAPTTTTAEQDVVALRRTQAAFELRGVSAVSVPFGTGVRIVYRRNSAPDQVTGRRYRDEVERYELVSGGHEVVMELFGPVGADNVDAYRTMVQSLRAS